MYPSLSLEFNSRTQNKIFKHNILTLRPKTPALGVIYFNFRRQLYGISKYAVNFFFSARESKKKTPLFKNIFLTLTLDNNFGPVLQ